MTQLFANNAYGSLGATLASGATSLTLATGQGARFPSPTGGDFFLLTLVGLDSNGNENAWEIVKVTGRSTDALTIVRAQEGTTAATWTSGTRAELRATAGTFDSFTDATEAAAAAPVQSVAGRTGAVTLTKSDVGLANVENKSSATIRAELTSGNVTTALGFTPENAANKGAANGYAPLGSDSKIASTYLPSYVDDVLEYANYAALPAIGESGKIYVLLTPYTSGGITSSQFRWSGSAYTAIVASPGTTDAVTEGSLNLYFTNARAVAALAGLYLAAAGGTMTGNLNLASGTKITGDFTNASYASRVYFQTSTVNAQTVLSVLPNGTAVNSQLNLWGNSDPTNSPLGAVIINSTSVRLQSSAAGTGTILPLAFWIGSNEAARIDPTTRNLLIGGTTDDASGNKLQVTGGVGLTGNLALLGGTTNGVAYLNASKVLTTGNSLTFDGTNFGIGTSNTGYAKLTVTSGYQNLEFDTPSGISYVTSYNRTSSSWVDLSLRGNNLLFSVNGGESMRLTSTGLGIGTTSPLGKLHVLRNNTGATTVGIFDNQQAGQYSTAILFRAAAGYDWLMGKDPLGAGNDSLGFALNGGSSNLLTLTPAGNLGLGVAPTANTSGKTIEVGAAGNIFRGSGVNDVNIDSNAYYNAGWKYAANGYANRFAAGDGVGSFKWFTAPNNASGAGAAATFTQAMTLDSSGNLGLGVTPSAWGSTYKVIETLGGSFGGNTAGLVTIHQNAYNNSGWKYRNTLPASLYEQSAGSHVWYTAPSGTAGAAISFTQAMTLDASGNLGIGTTSPSYKLDVSRSTTGASARFANSSSYGQVFIEAGGTNQNAYLSFTPTGTGKAIIQVGGGDYVQIDSSGNLIHSAPTTPPTLATNGTMVFNLTSNTNLRVSVRGSDGVTRTANITLA